MGDILAVLTYILIVALSVFGGFFFARMRLYSENGLGRAFLLAQERLSSLEKQLAIEKQAVLDVKNDLLISQEQLQQKTEKLTRFEIEHTALSRRLREREDDFTHWQQDLQKRFEDLANRVMVENVKTFEDHSKRQLDQVLMPIRDNLQSLQTQLQQSVTTQLQGHTALREHIQTMVKTHQTVGQQADSLARALRGDVKAQGNWGEVLLEKILEDSGLRKDYDYRVQANGMKLRHPETGSALRPDIVVFLPDDKHVIIDSKVSLIDYEGYCRSDNKEQRDAYLKRYLGSLRAHVQDLAKKSYPDIAKLQAPDFVLMFVPIEGAYSLAIEKDPALHEQAWQQRIIMVSTSTLFATLRTIACVWRIELQNRNAQEIARRGGALYDKVAGFVTDMTKVGNHLQLASQTHESALKKLSSGQGNILRQIETLRDLGVKNQKNIVLPQELANKELSA